MTELHWEGLTFQQVIKNENQFFSLSKLELTSYINLKFKHFSERYAFDLQV